MTGRSFHLKNAIGWCPEHEKLLYPSRKEARRVARQHAGKNEHKSPYPCDTRDGYWHIGELGYLVTSGVMTRGERYGQLG